jgi:hypothetical protein
LRPGSSRDPGRFTIRRRRGGRVPPSRSWRGSPPRVGLSWSTLPLREAAALPWRRTIKLSERPTPRGRHSETREHKPIGNLEGAKRGRAASFSRFRAERTSEDDGLSTTKGPGVKEKAMDHHLREIADCLDEVLRLQSRVMDLTEQVSEAAGMDPGDRTLRGKVTGLFFGVQAYLQELNRLAKDTA